MAMQKVYNRINWENYPILDTPINKQNLNKIDVATDELDNRVITHENVKATKEEVAPLIKEIGFNSKTGVFTITRKDGSSFTIDTLLEKIQTNWDYDPQTQKLILTMEDGTTQAIDLSELITQFEFVDTATIDFSIDNSTGKVSAIVKEGSIEEKHLRPNYLADIKVESAKAEAARAAAEVSEANAKKSENAAAKSASDSASSASASSDSADASAASAAAALASQNAAKASETAAKNSQTAAKTSETNAGNSATAAKNSETNAGKSATAAAASATAAATSAAESAESAENAAASETNAGKSASAAATSEKNAKTSETNATTQATSAKNSATSAATSASTATTKASEAATSATNAASSADTATRQATSASSSASTATTQANAAKTSATDAANSAKLAQSYTKGNTGLRPGEATDSAEYYYNQSKSISESFAGALRPMGTVTFANLPTLSSVAGGNMYNISDGFTTTAQFKEGAGHPYPAGTNVYKTADGYWDCLAGTPVNSVNGRRGDVVLAKTDVGLGNVDNTTDANKNVNSAKTATTATTANKVANALTFTGAVSATYNGSEAKTVNIPANTDTKVTETLVSDNATYPLLLGTKGLSTTATTTACFDSGVTLNPSNNTIAASISGKAATAGTADKVAHALTFTGAAAGTTFDGSVAKSVVIPEAANNATLTIKQGNAVKGTFTANASQDVTVELTDADTKYTLPVASSTTRGGVKIGYAQNGRNYPVQLSSEQMFVNVPWTDNNTDTKVTQTAVTDSANYPLLLAPKGQTTNQTTTACFDSGVYLNPSTNTINANTSGKATTAGTADKVAHALTFTGAVTGNFDGSVAKSVAIPSVANSLTSTSTTDALSAAQGKALNDRISSTATDLGTNINSLSTNKLDKTGDTQNNTTTFTSGDASNANGWTNVNVITSGEKHSSLFNKISTMCKNVRWLFSKLGTTDLTGIGNGTVTGAISALNSNYLDYGRGILYEPANDLNSYEEFCTVYVWSDSQAVTSKHFPCNIAGILQVIPTYYNPQNRYIYIKQIYTPRNCSNVYTRMYDNNISGWTAWISLK